MNELITILEWLECHNKQYTKKQYDKIYDALELAKNLAISNDELISELRTKINALESYIEIIERR